MSSSKIETIEVRWYAKGKPPPTVQHWFEFECLGKSLGLESRRDCYAYCQPNLLDKIARFSNRALNREEINLKLRQGNLELKLRQQFGIHEFGHQHNSHICEGKIEQWCKYSQQELKDSNLLDRDLLNQLNWISVDKKREQKTEQDVTSELTCLKIDRECWWTVAFEMNHDIHQRRQEEYFKQIVQRACKTYSGPKLLAIDSYGYSQWLLGFLARAIPTQKLNFNNLQVDL